MKRRRKLSEKGRKMSSAILNTEQNVNDDAEKEVIEAFWAWFEAERVKRDLTYQEVADAYRGMGKRLNASSVFRASNEKSEPSTKMINTIAMAFDMQFNEVLEHTHLVKKVPKDFIDGNPTLAQVLENARHMTLDELDAVIAMQRALIEQRKRKAGRSNH